MFTPETNKYASNMKEITIGSGESAITIGGKQTYPFHHFEGESPNKPKIAMEMWDMNPTGVWPEAVLAPFKDVVTNPIKWAEKCVADGADIIVLHLRSTDPNGENRSAEDAAQLVKNVAEAIGDLPLIVWGTASVEKDEEVLKAVAEVCQDRSLILGPVEEANHKAIGAAALGYKHMLISSSPIDVNIAKQTNILLENLGMPLDKVLIDPTTGGIGYGMEYSYSVMERVLQAAMMQGDDKLQNPMINFLSFEIWKCKEAGQSVEDAPTLGDPERRGILLETTCAVNLLMAGSDLLVMRHPEAVRLVRSYINLMVDGGDARAIPGISKILDEVRIDYTAFAPVPDLSVEEIQARAAAPKKQAKEQTPPAIKKDQTKVEAKKPSAPVKSAETSEEEVTVVSSAASCGSSNAQRQAESAIVAEEKVLQATKLREEQEMAAKQEVIEQQKRAKEQERLAVEQKEQEAISAKRKAQQEVEEAQNRHQAEEEALRTRRAEQRTQHENEPIMSCAQVSHTPAQEHKNPLKKMIQRLDLIHKRNKY